MNPVFAKRILVPAVALLAAFALQSIGDAQTQPALPDVAGFRPGMPIQEAYKLLKAHNPKAGVVADEIRVPELSDRPLPHRLHQSEGAVSDSAEVVTLDLTLPPSAQVVWKVSRHLQFVRSANLGQPAPGQQPMARDNLMAALREKYGQEFSFVSTGPDFIWLFDQRGARAPDTGGGLYRECRGVLGDGKPGITGGNANPHLSPYEPNQPTQTAPSPCFSLASVWATLGTVGSLSSPMIWSMDVAVADVGLGLRARQASYDYIASVHAKQKQQELDRAKQRAAPKL